MAVLDVTQIIRLIFAVKQISVICRYLLILHFLCRYTGFDDIQAVNTDESRAEHILQQLHKQAELRQQEREAVGKYKQKLPEIAGKEFVVNNYQPVYIILMICDLLTIHWAGISHRYVVLKAWLWP